MHSIAKDLAVFIKYLFEGKVTREKTLGKMITPTIEIDENIYYGYSVIIEQINERTVYWHTGGIGYSSIYYFPDNKLSIAVLCNQMIDPKSMSIALFETYLENCG